MRILHTSDWHVGRTIRGRSRDDEHAAVLSEIVEIVRSERVDLVLVAGDIFDHATPSPAAEQIVYETLLDLVAAEARVVLIAGNHDNPRRLQAVKPLLELAKVHVGATLQRAGEGGVVDVTVTSGETARVALLPWLSQRGIVRADDLMSLAQADHQGLYADRCARVLDALTGDFSSRTTVNLVLGHLTVTNAKLGGGERGAETIFDYWVPSENLPKNAQYIALGHIHRAQKLPLISPAWYSGSPLQLDFGEQPEGQCVLVFEARPGVPVGRVDRVPLRSGRTLLTIGGDLAELRTLHEANAGFADVYLRVDVVEAARPGLADTVRDLFPDAVDVRITRDASSEPLTQSRSGMSPRDLLTAYLEQQRAVDGAVLALFDDLMTGAGDAA